MNITFADEAELRTQFEIWYGPQSRIALEQKDLAWFAFKAGCLYAYLDIGMQLGTAFRAPEKE